MSVSISSQRQDERYASRQPDSLQSRLMLLINDQLHALPCDLSDISCGGCAVRVKLGEHVDVQVGVLRLVDPELGINLDVAGKLCWKQQTSVGVNTFGFRFRQRLEASMIDQLINQGVVTRRQVHRVRCDGEIDVRRAHGKEPVGYAVLEDCSSTGVRLSMDVLPEVGERLLLSSESGRSGSVSVVWSSTGSEGHHCGCLFVNVRSSRSINDAVREALA
ncbi:MAG: PilZ domain-containing protein [Planctomycetota bacterium]